MNEIITLQHLSKVNGLILEENKVRTRHKNSCFLPSYKLPILANPSLACLVGHSFGDGNIEYGAFGFTNNSLELIGEVFSNINKIGFQNLTCNFSFWKAYRFRFPRIVREVVILAGAPVGNKIIQSFNLPQWIEFGESEIKSKFLRALFDDEGSVKEESRGITLKFAKRIDLVDNLRSFLKNISCILKEFGIEGVSITDDLEHDGKNGKTKQLVLHICGIKSFIKFQKLIGFSNSGKRLKLTRMIENTRRIKLRDNEGKEKILANFRGKTLTTVQLASFLIISKLAAWKQMNRMVNLGLAKKIKLKNQRFNSNLWLVKE